MEFGEKVRELKSFLYKTLYRHPSVIKTSDQGRDMISVLFKYFQQHPKEIPETYRIRIESEGLDRSVCDFVAGMTDRYAETVFKDLRK